LTCQVTAVFVLPPTVAVNACVPKEFTFGATGDTDTVTFEGTEVAVIVTCALPDFVLSFAATAMIVTSAGLGTVAGAVYNPAVDIVPFALPPTTLHVTPWLFVSVTTA
jgi:hypothetical protein